MTKIKEVPAVDRPREKMLAYGASKLSTSELIAVLLRTGRAGYNAVEVGRTILQRFGVHGLAGATVAELSATSGVGPVKALEILAALELGRRVLLQKKSELLLSPEEVWKELKDIRVLKKEHCVVFYLDAVHQVIKRELISVGILNAGLIHPREVFEPAIRHLAAEVIIAHNHPSGDLKPSDSDVEVTGRLAAAGDLLGIKLTDHVIVTEQSFFSLKEAQLIKYTQLLN